MQIYDTEYKVATLELNSSRLYALDDLKSKYPDFYTVEYYNNGKWE